MNVRTLGTCGVCGGPVVVPLIFWSVVPPKPRCAHCGRIPVAYGPVIPMQPRRGPAIKTATGHP